MESNGIIAPDVELPQLDLQVTLEHERKFRYQLFPITAESPDFTPLLRLDMWEHADYLQYKNVKGDYVKAAWNVFNWDDVAERFAAAKK